jgi:hypothetical protein
MLSEKCHYAESRFSESRGAIAIFQVEKKNCFVQFFFGNSSSTKTAPTTDLKKVCLRPGLSLDCQARGERYRNLFFRRLQNISHLVPSPPNSSVFAFALLQIAAIII